MNTHHHHGCCGCSHGAGMPRRTFFAAVGGAAIGVAALAEMASAAAESPGGAAPFPVAIPRKALVVQPVLSYRVWQPAEKTSWRGWGGFHSEADYDAEAVQAVKPGN